MARARIRPSCSITTLPLPEIGSGKAVRHGQRRAASSTSRTLALIVVFDIGNVLVRWDRRNLFRKVFTDEARMEYFLATACNMGFVAHTDVVADFSQAVA